MTHYRIYEKPGDWTGTTIQKYEIQLSYHSGFRDDENLLIIEDDICHALFNLYTCDDWTGKRNEHSIMSTLLSERSLDLLIEVLQKVKDHHAAQDRIWEENGKTWLSSNKGPHPGPTEEQNRIYLLPWELVYDSDKKRVPSEYIKKP